MGRPSEYSDELAAEICSRIIESDYGLEQICGGDDLPSARTVFRWLVAHDSFRQQYARAKVAQGDIQAGRAIRDALEAKDAGLGRLKFDARKWSASKLDPKQHGDKVALVGGGEGDEPIKTRLDVGTLTEEQLAVIAAIRLNAG